MPDHVRNRESILGTLRAELVGPSPAGDEIDVTGEISFQDAKSSYGPWRQKSSGEEILQRDPPVKRYGVGVLYPLGTPLEVSREDGVAIPTEMTGGSPIAEEEKPRHLISEEAQKQIEEIAKRSGLGADPEPDDFDLSSANSYRPSTMAVTFFAEFPDSSTLTVDVTGGRYRRKQISVQGQDRIWWLRQAVKLRATFQSEALLSSSERLVRPQQTTAEGAEGLSLSVEAFSRPAGNGRALVTVSLINRSQGSATDEQCLFQSRFEVAVRAPDGRLCVFPYPEGPATRLDAEEESIRLLYRDSQTFAIGHGCAADWRTDEAAERAAIVSAEALPAFETASITPEVTRPDGSAVAVPMNCLAGLVSGDDGSLTINELVSLYRSWIDAREKSIPGLPPNYQGPARRHMAACRTTLSRMEFGLRFIQTDPVAAEAFRLTNHAILLQQLRTRREARKARFDPALRRVVFDEPITSPDPLHPPTDRGSWRPFQIAFLLAALQSSVDQRATDRETVELIWFPTGGGKTEAYLALAAFAMFYRRLQDSSHSGVDALMRYTLRLLTAQQFQRASALLCAMEVLRRKQPEKLGQVAFSIGIWLGSNTTPNRRDDARSVLKALQRGDQYAENKFILTKCPWCSAQIGPLPRSKNLPKAAPRVLGYEQRGSTVALHCSDSSCDFIDKLPVYVIDEDIYEFRPSLVIGTVDKFAMLAWKPESRALFGLAADGTRLSAPPGLIIQDELHLISGPLGSMVGLYESVIEELCTDRSHEPPTRPKIISSTATIRRYAEQIRALYARDAVALFPPPGLDAGDSFFARYARNQDGTLAHGRTYVGVHGPGLGSVQTAQVRSFAALLQAPVVLSAEERDPWWTLMMFFNSLRELGTSLSLYQSDIPDYLRVIQNRLGFDFSSLRRLRRLLELTGRLRSDEVPAAIEALEVPTTSSALPIDACLASNIIEVGIDIDRLSLMAVFGQPKTTSQYIQVTGRVGRRWWERPGLIVTIYSPSKPRDRSHFEQFRSYHERLYAQVEPTSVTPFSPPVLDRALHAVITSYVRQDGDRAAADSPYPVPVPLIDRFRDLLRERVQVVDDDESGTLERVFEKRLSEWKRWKRTRWDGQPSGADAPLLREAGEYAPGAIASLSWPTPTSLRNVDAECQAEITRLYLLEEEQE